MFSFVALTNQFNYMKRLLLSLAIAACMTTFADAQSYNNVIKTNPLGLAFGNFNATYEKVLNEKSSVLLSGNYLYQFLGIDVNTFGLGAAYRYYFTYAKKDVPSGFYVNPQIGFQSGSADDDLSYSAFNIGAEIGYQIAYESGFVLDFGIGPNFTSLSGDYEDISFTDDGSATTIVPSLTVAIGYAF